MNLEYRWKIIEIEDQEKVKRLASQINVSEPIARILVSRGIDSFEKARKFFRPSLDDLYDPFLMSDMRRAVDRISEALIRNQKILIYGDYDVDGTTGAAMLYLFFKSLGANVDVYIPDRFKEGYGISKVGIERAHLRDVKLLISVDCGITAVDEVEYAKSLGIDVIICDHHEPGEFLPNAYAVLDPLKENCNYPFKFLSGCGVAFKLIQAISGELGQTDEPFKYLDYVAIAAAADIVPLVDENRVLVKYGLEMLNSNPRVSFLALFETAGLNVGEVNTTQIGFIIAPRINAVGRLGDATRAVEFLISDDYKQARYWAEELERENRRRREFDERALNQALEMIERERIYERDKVIVLHNPEWHQGVIGIVASRIVDRYYRPTVLLTTADGILKGSARSIPGFDIYQALRRCEDILIQFGGHKHAAGMILEMGKLGEFRRILNEVADEVITEEHFVRELKIDARVEIEKITPKFWNVIKQFEPFGPGNGEPVFLSENVKIFDSRVVGISSERSGHLRFKIRNDKVVYDAIGFGLGDLYERVRDKDTVDIVFTLDESDWNGETFIQLKIKDIK
jgi:single-stranded-DNA-specific exonuclease